MKIFINNLFIKSFILVFILLGGCAGSPMALEKQNSKNLLLLKPNMTIEELIISMGTPQKTEMYRGKNNEIVMTYFYLTNGMGYVHNPENETNYTPVIFIDNRLTGWGWSQLDTTANRYECIIKRR